MTVFSPLSSFKAQQMFAGDGLIGSGRVEGDRISGSPAALGPRLDSLPPQSTSWPPACLPSPWHCLQCCCRVATTRTRRSACLPNQKTALKHHLCHNMSESKRLLDVQSDLRCRCTRRLEEEVTERRLSSRRRLSLSSRRRPGSFNDNDNDNLEYAKFCCDDYVPPGMTTDPPGWWWKTTPAPNQNSCLGSVL